MTKFEIGKKYKHKYSPYIYECIAFTSGSNEPVMQYTAASYDFVLVARENSDPSFTEIKPERWVNLYYNKYTNYNSEITMGGIHSSKEEADKFNTSDKDYLATVKLPD